MKDEFIDTLKELREKEEALFGSPQRMEAVVEYYMSLMEECGITITRESLLKTFKGALEMIRENEEIEKRLEQYKNKK